jgi:hypothetical protein
MTSHPDECSSLLPCVSSMAVVPSIPSSVSADWSFKKHTSYRLLTEAPLTGLKWKLVSHQSLSQLLPVAEADSTTLAHDTGGLESDSNSTLTSYGTLAKSLSLSLRFLICKIKNVHLLHEVL